MDPIQALFLQANKQANSFPPNSRYHQTAYAVLEEPDQEPKAYLKRRFLPSPDEFTAVEEHIVQQGERLDNITYRYLGDPELYWRIADANATMHPLDLTDTVNRFIRITMPHGLPG